MLIALPNLDGSFTATLILAHSGEATSFAALQTPSQVMDFFARWFPDAIPLFPEFAHQFHSNPTGDLLTIRCPPWSVGGQVVLIGDAAHAMVPFFGQGMNAAFEDCTILMAALDHHGPDWQRVFAEYQAQRMDDGHAIATMAIENYREMCDSVADTRWQFRKQVEHLLEREFPGQYLARARDLLRQRAW